MKKLFWLLTAILLVSSPRAEAQPKKIPQIGVLSASSPSAALRRIRAFQQGLVERGYIDGTNIKIEYRYAEGKSDQLALRAAELVGLKVDIILAQNNTVASSVAALTKTIPIVLFNGSEFSLEYNVFYFCSNNLAYLFRSRTLFSALSNFN